MLSESIKLDEALCSEQNLRFGCCEASQFSVQIANSAVSLEGKTINVSVTMDEETTKYGTFKVISDKPTADRIWRVITAYDKMYDIINADVLEWYKGLTFPMTLNSFRNSFFNHLGITQESTSLINDNFNIPGGFTATGSLSGKTIITAICEFNGVFGHINRDGNFEYISLDNASSFNCPSYENNSVTYEDYVTAVITKVTMRGSASDVGTSVGIAGNEYIITNNPLIYGTEGTSALTTALTNLLNKISLVTYRPFELKKTIGNPCVELGDAIVITTKYQTINSFVLKRVLSGIQALRDNYSATGKKYYPKEVNTVQEQINRTQGKLNELKRTVDGTVSTVTQLGTDVGAIQSEVSQMASEIVLKVDSNGRVVKVALDSNPSTGTEFKVSADNISFIANGVIDLSANTLSVNTTNFSLDSVGNITLKNNANIVVNGTSNQEGYSGITFNYEVSGYGETYQSSLNPSILVIKTTNFQEENKVMISPNTGLNKMIDLRTTNLRASSTDVSYADIHIGPNTGSNSFIDMNTKVGNTTTSIFSVSNTGQIKSNSLTASKILVSDSNKNIVSSDAGIDDVLLVRGMATQSDFNSITTPGSYWINPSITTGNHPFSGSYGVLNVYSVFGTTDGLLQEFTVYNGADHSGRTTFRLKVNNVWCLWNNKVWLWNDAEGGNISIFGPNGNEWQIDSYDSSQLRFYTWNNGVYKGIYIDNDGCIHANNIKSSVKANAIVQRDSSGYIYSQFYNASMSAENCNSYSSVYPVWIDGSGWMRKSGRSNFVTWLQCLTKLSQSGSIYAANSMGVYASSETMISGTDKGNRIWSCSSGSDKRLKENIKDTEVNGLETINKIHLHEFDFKDKKYGTHEDIGFIAQELQKVVPECVIEVPTDEEDKKKYGDNVLYVEDKPLIKYLVKAIQELSAEVEELKKKTEE